MKMPPRGLAVNWSGLLHLFAGIEAPVDQEEVEHGALLRATNWRWWW